MACVAIPLGVFAQQVRSYSQSASVGEAIRMTLDTPPSTFQISDLSVFDNLVALQELVPGDVPRLHGSTLAAIPTAFVPRALWPEKAARRRSSDDDDPLPRADGRVAGRAAG